MRLTEEKQKEVDNVYRSLAKVAKDITEKHTKEMDSIVDSLIAVENFTDQQIRSSMLRLSCLAYQLAEIKEHSSLRADCAVALSKEKAATEYNATQGTQGARENQSIINSMDNRAVQILYTNISKIFSTKLDEAHRVVKTLNDILIGRAADNKYAKQYNTEEVQQPGNDTY